MMFKPTYLYIKQHSITKRLYFGKTTKVDPVKYKGSGKQWILHIKQNGVDKVETLWYCLFYTKEECTKFALLFSTQQNIVKDNSWLNLKMETGVDGGAALGNKNSLGRKDSPQRLKQKSLFMLNNKFSAGSKQPKSQETREKISLAHMGMKLSEEHKANLSISKRGNKNASGASHPKYVCPYCSLECSKGNLTRWHYDKCKQKGNK